MLLYLLLASLPSPAEPVASAPAVSTGSFADISEKCPRARTRHAQERRAVRPQRLIDLPPGRLELTVLREVDGCPIPAVLREGIGGAGMAGPADKDD